MYWLCLDPLVLLEGRVTANNYKVVLTDYLHPMTLPKWWQQVLYCIFQQLLIFLKIATLCFIILLLNCWIELNWSFLWFHECEYYVKHMPWPSQSLGLILIWHLWEILVFCVGQCSPPHQKKLIQEIFLGNGVHPFITVPEMCGFYAKVLCGAVMVAHGDSIPY